MRTASRSEDERFKDEATQTISAKHFQITLYNLGSIELQNLSVNGTLLDGKPVEKAVLIEDLARRAHEISFGMQRADAAGVARRCRPPPSPSHR